MSLHLIQNYGFIELLITMYKENKTIEQLFSEYNNHREFDFNNRLIDLKTSKKVIDNFFKEEDIKKCTVCSIQNLNKNIRSSYHLGHIVPKSKNGSNCFNNLIPVCPSCNSHCRDRNMEEYCLSTYNRKIIR